MLRLLLVMVMLVSSLSTGWYRIKTKDGLMRIHSTQVKVLQKVINYSKKHADGWHIALAAIALNESSGGIDMLGDLVNGRVNINTSSLGVLHIRVPTVRYLIKKYPRKLKWLKHKSNYYIAQKLLRSVKFSAMLAGLLMQVNQKLSKSSGETVTRYNGGKKIGHYYKKYLKNRRLVNKLIRLGILHK